MRQKPCCLTDSKASFLFYYLPGIYPITLGHFIDENKAVYETIKDFDEYVCLDLVIPGFLDRIGQKLQKK